MNDGIEIKHIKAYVQANGIIRIDNVQNGERNLIGRLCDDVEYKDLPEYKLDLAEAVKLLTTSIKEDPDLELAYKANIAMAFVDAAEGIPGFKGVPNHILHLVANNAAGRFLQNWCKS